MSTLEFKPVTMRDGAKLRRYYRDCNYGLCEYSTGTKLMWNRTLHPAWAEAAGCLIVRNVFGEEMVFDYPVPGPEGDVDAALDAIDDWCIQEGIPPVLSVVPESQASHLLSRYMYAQVSSVRTWRDYVYAAEDMRTFAGRRYSGQRNHINKFRAACPDASFRVLGAEDKPLIQAFWDEYDQVFTKTSAMAQRELSFAKKLLNQVGRPWFRVGGMMHQGRLISLTLTEKCGDTLIIHIEKALYGYPGVYPATVQTAAQAFASDVLWINREDDAADKGLRTSKLQYLPARIAPKFRFRAQNELGAHVPQIPTLTTEHLTLDALTDADADAYYALCTDRERNRWWGYDDIAGAGPNPCQETFLRITREDFAKRLAINFAVRLDGKCIGEAVLYRFDYKGGAELGCRIAPEYAGNGYGTEAFAAVADWALYKVHLTRVVAKCYKENEASRKMLSSCMRPNGEDDTFYYFQKLV